MKTNRFSQLGLMILLSVLIFMIYSFKLENSEKENRIPIIITSNPQSTIIIDKSGSYYLTGNMNCIQTGIIIKSNNITIDLNGYTIAGVVDTGKYDGIFLDNVKNIEIKNGTITKFSGRGIRGKDTIQDLKFIELNVFDNGGCGICLDNLNCYTIDNCISSGNNGNGYCLGSYGILKSSVSKFNKGSGVSSQVGMIVTGCSFHNNNNTGLLCKSNSRIEGNMIFNNNKGNGPRYAGLIIFDGSIVRNNTLKNNSITSIEIVKNDNIIKDNVITYDDKVTGIAYKFDNQKKNEVTDNCCSDNCNNNEGLKSNK